MPIIFLSLLAVALLTGSAIASMMWPKILGWAENNLFLWISRNLPEFEPLVRHAFAMLDKGVVAVRAAAREAWTSLRRNLLKQAAEFIREFDGNWVVQVTSWIVRNAVEARPEVTKIVTQQRLSYDELPADVRETYLRNNQTKHEINVTDLRDAELSIITS